MTEQYVYIRAATSSGLGRFAEGLLTLLDGESTMHHARTDATMQRYREFLESLGEDGVTEYLLTRMQGHTMALLENEYPYDGLIPDDGEVSQTGGIRHYCLWSLDEGLLTPEYIARVIDLNFFCLPSLVFLHAEELKSIHTIPHIHIIVDWGTENPVLAQPFFETEDFSDQDLWPADTD